MRRDSSTRDHGLDLALTLEVPEEEDMAAVLEVEVQGFRRGRG